MVFYQENLIFCLYQILKSTVLINPLKENVMLKRNVTLVLLLLLVPCFLMGQTTKVLRAPQGVKLADNENTNVSMVYNKSVKLNKNTAAVGESIGITTQYDYFTNCI